jgi:hypothetical protein
VDADRESWDDEGRGYDSRACKPGLVCFIAGAPSSTTELSATFVSIEPWGGGLPAGDGGPERRLESPFTLMFCYLMKQGLKLGLINGGPPPLREAQATVRKMRLARLRTATHGMVLTFCINMLTFCIYIVYLNSYLYPILEGTQQTRRPTVRWLGRSHIPRVEGQRGGGARRARLPSRDAVALVAQRRAALPLYFGGKYCRRVSPE